jgi:hypothetical protein
LKFGSPPRSWITGQLTGTYAAGVWTAKVFTQPVTTATSLQSRLYRKGAGAEVLIATAQADIDLANGTNHATVFSFNGVPELTLAGETLRLELTKLSGPIVTLIANGNDFDSRLEAPVSAWGTVDTAPAPTPWVDPPVPPFTGPATLGVYADTAVAGTWAVLAGPSSFGAAGTATNLTPVSTLADAKEGTNSLAVNLTADGQGFSWAGANTDLRAYTHLHFWIKIDPSRASTEWVRVRMAGSGPLGTYDLYTHDGLGNYASRLAATTEWQEVVIPLTSLAGLGPAELAAINTPFGIEAVGGTPNFAAHVDNVYFSVK